MALLEELRQLGVNVDEALDRMMGNASLYERVLGKFLALIDNSAVSPDFDGNDYADIIEKAHAIKGATGNLSLTPLHKAYDEIVTLLRADKPEEAREVLKNILPIQEQIYECIKKHAS